MIEEVNDVLDKEFEMFDKIFNVFCGYCVLVVGDVVEVYIKFKEVGIENKGFVSEICYLVGEIEKVIEDV